MPVNAGTRFGPYEVVAPLGAGGMGEVYKARDTRLDRTVAIKILPEILARDPQFQQRFNREARAISQLDHPHICPLYDVGSEQGTSFLVMQYLEGETLADRLRMGALPRDQALDYGIQIADALDKAHRVGIVHRDLKPANIFLTKGGAKLLDFGLAKIGAEMITSASTRSTPPANLTAEGTILGTVQYMAPEQLEGKRPMREPTFLPSAPCCMRWRLAGEHSTVAVRRACSQQSCRRTHRQCRRFSPARLPCSITLWPAASRRIATIAGKRQAISCES
jgi:serine/threonine protein kinase